MVIVEKIVEKNSVIHRIFKKLGEFTWDTTKYGHLSSTTRLQNIQKFPPFQKSYQDIARKERSSQFGEDFMKTSWNEADSNQLKGSSIAAFRWKEFPLSSLSWFWTISFEMLAPPIPVFLPENYIRSFTCPIFFLTFPAIHKLTGNELHI